MLPNRGWTTYETGLRAIGERRSSEQEIVEFLHSLGLVSGGTPELTNAGRTFFHRQFIEDDAAAATAVLRHQLLGACPEAAAICQLLANRPKVARDVAETVLRSQGYGNGLTDRKLGALLALLSRAEIIEYAKREGTFRVLAKPMDEPKLPDSIYISPDTPASNRIWLRRILGECNDFIFWLDKHFLPEGLDFVVEGADGARLKTVRVLSLALDENKSRKARRGYRDVARELSGRGIDFEWRFVNSKDIRDTHDRWIVTSGRSWNVPNLNAILSGQRSEMSVSGNTTELEAMFQTVWKKADPRPAEPRTTD